MGLIALAAALVLGLTVAAQLSPSADQSKRLPMAVLSMAVTALLLGVFLTEILRRVRTERALAVVDAALAPFSWVADEIDDQPMDQHLEGMAAGVATATGARTAALLVDDEVAASSRLGRPDGPSGPVVRLSTPLVSHGLRLGTLEITAEAGHDFTRADRLVLHLMGPPVAAYLERTRLADAERRSRLEAEQARRQVNVLARASVPLAPGLENPEETITELAAIVVPEFADLFAVDLDRGPGPLERVAVTAGDRGLVERFAQLGPRHPRWQEPLRHVMAEGASELAFSIAGDQDLPQDDHGALLRELGMQSWVVAPIQVRGESIGTMTLATTLGRRGYRPSDLVTIDDLVARSAIAFERGLLYREARQAAAEASRLYQDARDREQRLEALIGASPLAILEIDTAGTVLVANPAARALFPASDTAESLLAQIPVELDERMAALVAETVAGARCEVELTTTDDAGEQRDLWVSTAPVSGEGLDAVRMLAVITDMTGRKRLEEQLATAQRFEAIATLAGGVAHDFNNLLTVILGYSEILLHGLPETAPERASVEAIQEAGNHAAVITNQLLTLSRHQVLQPETIDAVERSRALVPMLRRLAGAGVDIETRLEGSARIKVDPGQLEQVLFNLVFNSRDAMPSGGHLCIEVGQQQAAGGPDVVFVRVTDDGDGMDAETLARCQEPFFTTKSRSRGIGLGLATVASILERSGGTLHMTSEVGRGTSSTVLFPSVDPAQSPAEPEPGPEPGRVLLVDDDEQVRRFAARVLSENGYGVTEVPDGESAIRQIETVGAFDLLVTDVQLPAMSGAAVVREVRERWPAMACLLITGFAEAHSLDVDVGDTMLVPKPFAPEDLLRAAAGALQRARSVGPPTR